MSTDINNEHEIILDKVRKVSMCGDQDRIINSKLLDKMATIAGQIALVARMGDDDDAISDIDDSEHIKTTTFALKADSHHLDGREAFSFDQAFDDDQEQPRPFQIGSMFEFMTTDEDGALHLSSVSVNHLQYHLEHIHLVGVFDFTLNTSPQSMPLFFSKMISSSKLLNVSELFPILMPESLNEIEGMILGFWGPLLHPPNNQIDQSSSSGRILYLVLKCQSLYQSMNSLVKNTPEMLAQSQCILKCATIISLLSQSIILSLDTPIDRTATTTSSSSSSSPPLASIQYQSSQIISSFLVSLSESCCQLIANNQSNEDETLKQKATLPPSLCIVRESTKHQQSSSNSNSPSLKILFSSLLADPKLNYFHSNAIYLQEICLDQSNPSPGVSSSDVLEDDSRISYYSFSKLLNNLLIAHINPMNSVTSQVSSTVWNGPYLIELAQIYLSYVELLYNNNYNYSPRNNEECNDNNDPVVPPSVDDTTGSTNPASALTSEQNSILTTAIEKYKSLMSQTFGDPATSPSISLCDNKSLETGIFVPLRKPSEVTYVGNSGNIYDATADFLLSPGYDEVDPNFYLSLQTTHARSRDAVLSEFQLKLEENSLIQHITQLFQQELSKYESHYHLRSHRFNEIVLKDCLEELSFPEKFSNNDDTQSTKLAELLEIYFHRARGPAKREVIARFLSKYSGDSQLKSENEILKGQLHQYHSNHLKMRSRLEELATENSQLHRTVEEKTDKALDAWAALHEKYSNLEKTLSQSQKENEMKDTYINKLKIHITQIEKMNAAMKYGVNKLLEEEGHRHNPHTPSSTSASSGAVPTAAATGTGIASSSSSSSSTFVSSDPGNGIFDIFSFALACATGSPIDAVDDDDSRRSGFNWEPSFENSNNNSQPTGGGGGAAGRHTKPKDTE